MIAKATKIPILRYCLIILLFCVLFTGTAYLYLHYQKARLLYNNIDNVVAARENSALIDSCIIRLYNADNNGRLYTLTGERSYLNNFSNDINKVLLTINNIKFKDKSIPDSNTARFKNLIEQKTIKTNIYLRLRVLTDSLIKSSVNFKESVKPVAVDAPPTISKPIVKVEHRVKIDTIRSKEPPRKKFFSRILSAFSSKKEEKAKITIIKKDTLIYSNLITTASASGKKIDSTKLISVNTKIKNYYNKLNTANNKLRTNELLVLKLNNNLIQEIIASLKSYKSVEQAYIQKSKIDLKESIAHVFLEFKQFSTITIACLIALFIIMIYNIWKIFESERELIDYSKSAEEYASLKSKFLAGMSHEIRTPLNSVIGFSEQLSQEDLPVAQKEQVVAIRNSSEMILDLVNEILDFSKYETGKMNFESSPFLLEQAFNDVFTTMHIHALKKHIALEKQIHIKDGFCCEGDQMRLKQVLMNLLGNAIKFTLSGKVILHATLDVNNLLKVKVIDTGLGIEKEDLPHVFDEFSQIAKAQKATRHKGTGLGLAICKKIIELQGGKITATSTIGIGSTFSFEIPLKQLSNNECVVTQAIPDDFMSDLVNDKYVLLAEDNKLNVLLTSTILKKWGIKFDVAYDGFEALQLFTVNEYDVVLTDIQMPVMDGLQLTQQIREHDDPIKANTIIIALTANVLKEDRDNYLNTGVSDILLKPFLEKQLIEKIALAIQNNQSAMRLLN